MNGRRRGSFWRQRRGITPHRSERTNILARKDRAHRTCSMVTAPSPKSAWPTADLGQGESSIAVTVETPPPSYGTCRLSVVRVTSTGRKLSDTEGGVASQEVARARRARGVVGRGERDWHRLAGPLGDNSTISGPHGTSRDDGGRTQEPARRPRALSGGRTS